MNKLTDHQLLRDYTGHRSEAAFANLVRRHVDLVYSTALRMVRDAHLAEDVAQGVFVALAQNARQLTDHPVLSGWLHRTTQNLAAKAIRTDVRRRACEQEAAAMNELHEPDGVWEHIAPQLDEALGELNEGDRDALLLRYFERKSAREMAQTLGTSEDAAQKRVSRALERLRAEFNRRGVTTTAIALSTAVSANAVSVAPAGLAAALSTAALTGTTLTTAATATATKAIAMTTLQKTIIGAALAAAVGTGIYEARQASQQRDQVQILQQQQAPLAEQIEQLNRALHAATNQIAGLSDDNERLNRNTGELLKLRGEVVRLQSDSRELRELKAFAAQKENDPMKPEVEFILGRVSQLRRGLERTPGKQIPEVQLLSGDNWLHLAQSTRGLNLDTDSGINEGLSQVRELAKQCAAGVIQAALRNYARANAGNLPTDVSQLKPYFNYQVDASILEQYPEATNQVDDAILQRYQMTKTGTVSGLQPQEIVMVEKATVDAQIDTLWQIGLNYTSWEGTGANKGRRGTIAGSR